MRDNIHQIYFLKINSAEFHEINVSQREINVSPHPFILHSSSLPLILDPSSFKLHPSLWFKPSPIKKNIIFLEQMRPISIVLDR